MFGGSNRRNNNNDKGGQSLSQVMTPENPPKKGGGASVTGFDPEGLERAAKALLPFSKFANGWKQIWKTDGFDTLISAVKQHPEAESLQRAVVKVLVELSDTKTVFVESGAGELVQGICAKFPDVGVSERFLQIHQT